MRKVILTMLLVLLVAVPVQAGSLQDTLAGLLGIEVDESKMMAEAPEADSQLTLWLLGAPEPDNPDVDISARVGWLADDLEFGLQADAQGLHGDNAEVFGAYALMHVSTEGILGTTYVGYHAGIDEDYRRFGPIAGTILDNIVVEYRYSDFSGDSPLDNANDRHQVYAGIVLRF